MTRVLLVPVAALLVVALAASAAAASGGGGPVLVLNVSLEPVNSSAWRVSVSAALAGARGLGGGRWSCSGLVGVNPFYRETRAVGRGLLVAPLYYVLDSVCPRLAALLPQLLPSAAGGEAVVRLSAPRGFLVAVPPGWGVGSASARVPLRVFLLYTLYDGVVAASPRGYRWRLLGGGLLLVEPRRGGVVDAGELGEAVGCVASRLGEWLGPSPAAPSVVVVASASEHPLVPPGTGYSLGTVVYVKPEPGSEASLVHLVAHEAVHGWLGKGPLRGGEGLVEGAAELLSLLALRSCSPRLYGLAMRYEEEAAGVNPYRTWLLLHAALWRAGLEACNSSVYLDALRALYRSADPSRPGGPGLPALYAEAARVAEGLGCREGLAERLGALLLVSDRLGPAGLLNATSTPPPRRAAPRASPAPGTATEAHGGGAAGAPQARGAPPGEAGGVGGWAGLLAAALSFLVIVCILLRGRWSV